MQEEILNKYLGKVKKSIDILNIFLFQKQLKANADYSVLIFGPPRSGTTLVMDILGTMNEYKVIFEPFKQSWFPQIEKFGLPPRIFIHPTSEHKLLEEYLDQVFKGLWSSKYYLITRSIRDRNLYKRLLSTKVIVKFINGNRLLPWINERFNVTSFLVFRHPCATISSQLKSGWIGYPEELEKRIFHEGDINLLRRIVLEEALMITNINKKQKLIKKIKNLDTIEELLAVEWSLDYYVPLSYGTRSFYPLIYEQLIKKEGELESIFNKLNQQVPKRAYNFLRTPSITSKERVIEVNKQLSKWRYELTQQQIENILNITNYFGLNFYTEKLEPDYKAIRGLESLP